MEDFGILLFYMKTELALKELLQKYHSGNCTAEEEKLLQNWFSRIGHGSSSSGLSEEGSKRMLHAFINSPRFAAPSGKQVKMGWRTIAAAAITMGIILFSLLYLRNNKKEIIFVQLETGIGQIKQIVLPDSSIVWLNARTKLSYHPDFTRHREIKLSGEALFEVTDDHEHPFTVITKDSLQTTVLGTRFNIRSYERLQETQVTVVSGRVQVAKPNNIMAVLAPDQALCYDHAKYSYTRIDVNATTSTDWSTGEWAMNVRGLEELTLLLYNQYGITLINKRNDLASLHLDANFKKQQSVREMVKVFCLLAGCRHQWKNDTTVELY